MAESMKGLKRTHRCAELSAANVGEKVTIMGWVQKNRNKGGLVFVDVRDRSGIIQVVFEEGKCEAALIEKAAKLRAEYVVAIVGTVAKRSGAVNEHLATGEIEVIPEELRILSESETPPFHIEENSKTKEEVRLKYRYLDLRRPDMQRNLMMRSKVATLTRQFLAEEGFLEIEDEVNSSIEGHKAVIATGGSAVYCANAMEHYKEIATVLYLSVSYETLEERLGDLKNRGVVLNDGQTLKDLYDERTAYYEKYADVTVNEEGLSIRETIDAVKEKLGME